MKLFICSMLFVYMIYRSSCDNTTYTSKYDEVNIDELLGNERVTVGYVNCLLNKGICTPDAKELKDNLEDAIKNNCSKCTEKQRKASEKVIKFLIKHMPEEWAELENMYDPEGMYWTVHLESNSTSKEDTIDEGHASQQK